MRQAARTHRPLSALQADACGHHRRPPGVDGANDLAAVDCLQVDRRDAQVGSWRWMMSSGSPSRAISTAWALRNRCGAKRRRTPPAAASRRSWIRTAGAVHGLPRAGPSMTQKSGLTGSATRRSCQGRSSPQPHSSIPTLRRRPPFPSRTSSAPRAGSRSPSRRSRLADPQAGAPEDDDQPAQPVPMCATTCLAHHANDLFDPRWIGGIAHSLVPRVRPR